MGLLSKLFRSDPVESQPDPRIVLSTAIPGVKEDLREAAFRVSEVTGRLPSECEQLLAFTAYVYHRARIESLPSQDVSRVQQDVVQAAKVAYIFLRVVMAEPAVSSAIRKCDSSFDPTDTTTTTTNFGGRINNAAAVYINTMKTASGFPLIRKLPLRVILAICRVMLEETFGVSAAEILVPSGVLKSDLDLKQFGEAIDWSESLARGGVKR
jgi:hypothetical protein